MADKVKTVSQLKIVMKFTDGDDRTMIIDNPKSDLAATDITALETKMLADKPLIGDKAGADFKRIQSATTVSQQTTYLDLTDTSGISTVGWGL